MSDMAKLIAWTLLCTATMILTSTTEYWWAWGIVASALSVLPTRPILEGITDAFEDLAEDSFDSDWDD